VAFGPWGGPWGRGEDNGRPEGPIRVSRGVIFGNRCVAVDAAVRVDDGIMVGRECTPRVQCFLWEPEL